MWIGIRVHVQRIVDEELFAGVYAADRFDAQHEPPAFPGLLLGLAVEWLVVQGSPRVMNQKSVLCKGRLISFMDYLDSAPGARPKRLYSVLDARTRALELNRSEHFGVLPPAKLNSAQRSLIELVRNKREQFFSDPALRYGELRTRLGAALAEATCLEKASKPREALAKLERADWSMCKR